MAKKKEDSMKSFLKCLVMAVVCTMTLTATVRAEDTMEAGSSDCWRITIEPSGWINQLSGSVTTASGVSKVKLDLTDYPSLLDELRMFLAGRVIVQKGRFSVFYDGWYVKLYDETNTALASTEVTFWNLIEELGASYDTAHWAVGGADKKNLGFEVLGGARHVYVRQKGSGEIPLHGITIGGDKTYQWVDPFIGGRFTLGLTDQTSVSLRGDVGGGASSGFLWNGVLNVKHYLTQNKNWFMTIGYRGMNTDYKKGDFKYQVDYFGPETTIGFTF
jgi:hypothetical protein